VDWPIYAIKDIVGELQRNDTILRVCISMVTNKRAPRDTLVVIDQLERAEKDISVLVAPTMIDRLWLEKIHDTSVDKVGIAVDAATPELFREYRGKGVNGPHRWDHYWQIFKDSISFFGAENTGIHLITGLKETERDIVKIIQKVRDMGSDTHLFSFFPEKGSDLENLPQPGIGTYRRVQLARELIFQQESSYEKMDFNEDGQIIGFGTPENVLNRIIEDGTAFMTQGCKNTHGFITCNRPYSNCTPFQAAKGELRNFPFKPTHNDIIIIKKQLADYNIDSWIRTLAEADDFLIDEIEDLAE
jgi:biotin synthase